MNMIHLRQTWQLIRQELFFSAVYIMGTGLAISMVMAIAVAYHIRTADIAPETRRERMAYLTSVSYKKNTNGTLNYYCGPRLAKEVMRELRVPEEVTVTTDLQSLGYDFDAYLQAPGGEEAPKVTLMGCDDSFWRVYQFRFLDGAGFTEADFASGLPRAVLSESVTRRLFGRTEVKGQTVLLNDLEYQVSGVVADVSGVTPDAYAEMWVPYSSLSFVMDRMRSEQDGMAGPLNVAFLLRQPSDLVALTEELAGATARYNATLAEGQVSYTDPRSFGQRLLEGMLGKNTLVVLAVVIALLLLVPALNLSGLNASRVQDRLSELGVRKAFGANRWALMGQIFLENLLLTLPGGVVGLFFSYGLVYAYRHILLQSFYGLMAGQGGDMPLSVGMLMNFEVFGLAFATCLALNLLSSMVPAWRMSRVAITDALNA